MRNGDFHPSRLVSAHEACNLVAGAKTQQNPENTVGLLTMSGQSAQLLETLTSNLGRLLAALSSVHPSGSLHFSDSLSIAALGLKHRQNKQQRQRIVAFVGSPLGETQQQLEALGKKLKKNSVAIDVVAFGVEENVQRLEALVNAANSQENSHLINVPLGVSLADVLVTSPLVADEAGSAPTAGNSGFEFGVDPAQDPELAMVLRMSMEDERRRQEAEQNKEAGSEPAAPTQPAPVQANRDKGLTEAQELEMALKMSLGGPAEEEQELTEEEQIELALKMSMNVDTEEGVNDTLNDPNFMAQLAQDIAGLDPRDLEKKEDEKKESEKK
eukprot:NODE_2495_length_1187_cov_28.458699_g2278_i0.p1 GENE.NODE_2495_length_1187_cov_28.458699_g2278_i0~~NODE_2495_length_1187_cov_28.458699_g2278_i0.p1  ORF type:complete len:360 (-),score=93.12 NODE_2495_length_1187_cov_28.458699_g2278_i0:107-1090(-)